MRRYLIVDDNVAFAENLAEIVRDDGAEVAVAADGAQALALVRTNCSPRVRKGFWPCSPNLRRCRGCSSCCAGRVAMAWSRWSRTILRWPTTWRKRCAIEASRWWPRGRYRKS